MAEYVSDISVDSAEKKEAGGENPPQVDHHFLEESVSPHTGDDRTGILSAEDTFEDVGPLKSTSPLRLQITPSTPTDEAETPRLAPTGRRVSFQVGRGEEGDNDLTTFVANRDGSIPPPASRQTPSAATSTSSLLPPTLHRHKRRDSEWVFRPLKLKFKVKELEELYRNYVYRQQLSLVFTACVIMVVLSLIVVISFFVNTKVHVHVCIPARSLCVFVGGYDVHCD